VQVLQLLKVRGFELVALAEKQFGLFVGLRALGLEALVVEGCSIERSQVRALVEVHEVGGGEQELGMAALHRILIWLDVPSSG
jgi:hypothetical protein